MSFHSSLNLAAACHEKQSSINNLGLLNTTYRSFKYDTREQSIQFKLEYDGRCRISTKNGKKARSITSEYKPTLKPNFNLKKIAFQIV